MRYEYRFNKKRHRDRPYHGREIVFNIFAFGAGLARHNGRTDQERGEQKVRQEGHHKGGRRFYPDTDILGFVDPGATVNIIKDSVIVEKKTLALPEKLVGVIKCKNPRCITSTEQELPDIFKLTDRSSATYRCIYCESKGER